MAELIKPRSPINQPTATANGIPASAISCLNHLKQIVIGVVPLPLSGPDRSPSKWHATPFNCLQTRKQELECALPQRPSRQIVMLELEVRDDVRRSATWLIQGRGTEGPGITLLLHSDSARKVNLVRKASWPWRQKLIASAIDFTEYWSA